jgi:hypothetical protein
MAIDHWSLPLYILFHSKENIGTEALDGCFLLKVDDPPSR